MKNCHIPGFENQSLLDTLVTPMSAESFIVKYSQQKAKLHYQSGSKRLFIPAYDNALYDIKFEETGDQMMHSNNYLDEENKDTKPFLEEITNDVNDHENIENDGLF